jgi:hypothetical protein
MCKTLLVALLRENNICKRCVHVKKINGSRGGANFDPQGFYLNNFGGNSLKDVSCQKPKL